MKSHLMYKDLDFDLEGTLPGWEPDLSQDLQLETLFNAMADGDVFLFRVAKKAVLTSLLDPEAILYRQGILSDCFDQPAVINQIYSLALAAIEGEKRIWGGSLGRNPDTKLYHSREVMTLFVDLLRKLRKIADESGPKFRSDGLSTFFSMLSNELNDEYLKSVEEHLGRLAFRHGVLISAELDRANKGAQYVLRRYERSDRGWLTKLRINLQQLRFGAPGKYSYQVPDRDESGFRALEELRGRGISHVASVLAQSSDHILDFFRMIRAELGFYIGCLNLRDQLAKKSEPISFPEPTAETGFQLSARGLYDVCLSLSVKKRIVANEIRANAKTLLMVTGANQGGKTTFLRSVGQAQLMMQCGMFVPAESFRANCCTCVHTHFKREEDATMQRGKLDEELNRMSSIVDRLTPNGMVLMNESFASTNEREGSEIARQIVRALIESSVKVVYVTHMFDLAQRFYLAELESALFLRAERKDDGSRTFRVIEGEPLPTSFGQDVYWRIFSSIERGVL